MCLIWMKVGYLAFCFILTFYTAGIESPQFAPLPGVSLVELIKQADQADQNGVSPTGSALESFFFPVAQFLATEVTLIHFSLSPQVAELLCIAAWVNIGVLVRSNEFVCTI